MNRNALRTLQTTLTPALLGLALAVLVRSDSASAADPADPVQAALERGHYLVAAMGCTDCHTPMKMGPHGPEPDMERYLAGHPADMQLPPPPPLGDGPWMATVTFTMTAWSGPWGISYSANLTPDVETGLGGWTEEEFLATARSGRHRGRGRELLPPMPREQLASLTDEDLRAVFTYLQSLHPVRNQVPAPQTKAMD